MCTFYNVNLIEGGGGVGVKADCLTRDLSL